MNQRLEQIDLNRTARDIALHDFKSYVEMVAPEFLISDHHELMMYEAEGSLIRPNAKTLIACPPRHSKSLLISNLFASYLMTKFQGFHVVVASYAGELSLELGRRTQSIFTSDNYKRIFQDITVSDDSSSKTRFHLSNGSSYFAVGVGGSLVGKSASILILDDAYKGLEQARSKAYQETLKNWYGGSFYTRRLRGAPLIIVNTLWTLNDLPLKLVEADPEGWSVLKLAAIREDGTALWPGMFSLEALLDIKRTIGTQAFQALYQQEPNPDEGAIIKRGWFKFYTQMPKLELMLQSWDLAVKDKVSSDFVVGLVMGRKGADKYIVDMFRARVDFPATVQAIRTMSAKHPTTYKKLIEDKANGPAVIATLKSKVSGLIPVEPVGDKFMRLNAVAPDVEAGNVYLPDPSIAPWVHDFIEEVCSFPTAKHDDIPDAFSQGLFELRRSGLSYQPIAGHGESVW